MKTDVHLRSYFAESSSEWEMFQTELVEKIKTRILFSVTYSRKSCRLWDNVEKNIVGPDRPEMTIWRRKDAIDMPAN